MEPPADGQAERAGAFGEQLIEIHDGLRDELERLRADVRSRLRGDRPGGTAQPPRDLRAHCLAFCTAVTRHHTGEDDIAFPAVAERFPELTPVPERLGDDHRFVSSIVHNIEALTDDLDPDGGIAEAERVDRELEGLSAILESHFRYEERTLFTALDTVGAARPAPDGEPR